MALRYEVFLIGGGILLAISAATYFIGRRSPLGAAAFFATAVLILIALNYV
jgi:hypothetical protein